MEDGERRGADASGPSPAGSVAPVNVGNEQGTQVGSGNVQFNVWLQPSRKRNLPLAGKPRERASTADLARPSVAVRVRDARPGELGVHPAIRVPGATGELPPYVPREVDAIVRTALAAGAWQGCFVLLVGGSSVGKTRLLFEAVRLLLADWWLIQPASCAEMEAFAASPTPRTVVWLDEMERYLTGERGLSPAAIRRLLQTREPVVIAGTLWPDRYRLYSALLPRDDDRYTAKRELLGLAQVIDVADSLNAEERTRASSLGVADPRIRAALDSADFGFTQVLAAAPELVRCWEHAADPYGKAVITAAIDARRLGIESAVSRDLLRHAAHGYLTEAQRAAASGDWLDRALAYASTPLLGAATALNPVADGIGQVTSYRAADYLLQHGAHARRTARLPASAWQAFIEHNDDVADLARLASNARNRGLYRSAESAYRKLAAAGDRSARDQLASLLAEQGRFDDAATALHLGRSADDWRAEQEFAELLGRYKRDRLRTLADAGGLKAASILAKLLARDSCLDELRARADAGDRSAGYHLAKLLVEMGRVDELRVRADSGDKNSAVRHASLLADQGFAEEAITALRPFANLDDLDDPDVDALPFGMLANLLSQHGHLDELRARAEAGEMFAVGRISEYDRIEELRRKADAGDIPAAIHLAWLSTERGQAEEAAGLLGPLADAGEVEAARSLAELLAKQGRIDDLRARADTGDAAASETLANLRSRRQREEREEEEQRARDHTVQMLFAQGRVDDLRMHVDANPDDIVMSLYLARLLYDNGDAEELRARADSFGDAAHQLTELLVGQDRIGELIDEVYAGNKFAKPAWERLLVAQGNYELAERLRKYGLHADGSVASE